MPQVWQALRTFMHEISQIRVDHAPPGALLDNRVKCEGDTETRWKTSAERYKAAVSRETAAAEFFCLLQFAADSRAHHLRCLLTPRTAMELLSDTYAFERAD